jgi:ELWxxDGT repeat protein
LQDTFGVELCKSDGTANGTQMIKDLNLGKYNSSEPVNLTVFNNKVYFFARGTYPVGDALWRTDGTSQGTNLVKDLSANSTTYHGPIVPFNNGLYFWVEDEIGEYSIWKSDGTIAGTGPTLDFTSDYISRLYAAENLLFFNAFGLFHRRRTLPV